MKVVNVIACLIMIKQLSTGIAVNLFAVDSHCDNLCLFSTTKIVTFGNSKSKTKNKTVK
jgi:hypothetical protein